MLLLVVFLFFRVAVAQQESNIVKTEFGPVRGYLREADCGKQYFSFRGVPYSKQPVGDLRFEQLQNPDEWTNVYDALDEVPMCFQRRQLLSPEYLQTGPMSEACLGANIHVPAKRDNNKQLPVLVWIYGGGFNYLNGDSDLYGPEYMVAKDIIFVTFNYRIGIFGFLSLNSSLAPGNLGIKDALFFLNWVKRNIAAFGGNPDDVTIGGQSSGAATANLLLLIPQSRGLFNRIIMLSGTASAGFVLGINPQYNSLINSMLMKYLKIDTTDPDEIFKILKAMDTEKLVDASNYLIDIMGLTAFTPVIEPQIDGVNTIIHADPYNIMLSKEYIDVPQIIGFTKDETLSFERRLKTIGILDIVRANAAMLVPADIKFRVNNPSLNLTDIFLKKYFKDGVVGEDDWPGVEAIFDDALFRYPVLRYAKFSAVNNVAPTYLYEFAFDGENNLISKKVAGASRTGAAHGDDLNYLFKGNFYDTSETMKSNTIEETVKNKMVEMWTNFVKTGDPNLSAKDVVWPRLDPETMSHLKIDSEFTIATNPYPDVIKFYEQFYPPVTKV